MKRIAIIAGLVLILAVWGIFFISGQRSNEVAPGGPTKVGMLMIGSREDSSWNEAHWEGIQAAAKELDLSLDCEEDVAPEDCEAILERMVQNGCKIIISTSIDFQDAVVLAAQKHTNVYFFQATGTQERANLASYMGRMYQMRYLAGIVAGKQSHSGQIGYVTTEAIPEVVRGIDAFTLGVRKANPDAKVYVKYTGAWSNDDAAKKTTEALLAACPKIDVLGMHIDTNGVLDVAARRGIYAIGCNTDQHEKYPKIFLTAPVWNWSIFYKEYVHAALNNKFEGGNYVVGADTGIVALTPLRLPHDAEMDRMLSMEQNRLVNGEFDVFYGPIRDYEGQLRVGEGESLSDKTLFQELDWYVEGVVLQ